MAITVAQLLVEVNANAQPLQEALSATENQINSFRDLLSSLDSVWTAFSDAAATSLADVTEKLGTLPEALNGVAESLGNTGTDATDLGDNLAGIGEAAQTAASSATEALGELPSALGEADVSVADLGDSLSGLPEKLGAVGESADNVGEKLQSAGEHAGGLGESFTEALGHATEFATGMLEFTALSDASNAVGEFAGSLIGMNSQFEALHAQLTSITGSSKSADKIMAWVKQFGQQVPDTTEHLAEATVTIQSLGLNATQVVPSIADVAAAMGKDLPTAARAFSDAYEGRFMMMQNDLHVSKADLEKFGLQVDSSGKVVQSSLVPAFEKLAKAKFGNAIQNQMGTLNGQLSNLTDRVQFFAMQMGKPIFDLFKSTLANIFSFLDSHKALLNDVANLVGTGIAGAFTTLEHGVSKVAQEITPLIPKIEQLGKHLITMITYVATHKDTLKTFGAVLVGIGVGILASMVPAFVAWAVAAGAAAIATLAAAAPFIAIGLVIGVVVLALSKATNGFSGFQGVLKAGQKIFSEIAGVVGGALGDAFKHLQAVWKEIQPQLKELGNALTQLYPVLQVVGVVIGTIIVVAVGILMGVLNGLIGAIKGVIEVFTGVVNIVSGVFELLVGIFTLNGDKVKQALGKIGEGIKGVFGGLWDTVKGFLVGFVQGVIGFFEHLFDKLVGHSIVPDMITAIIGFFLGLPGKILGGLGAFVGSVIGKFGDLAKGATQHAADMAKQVTQGAQDMAKGVGSIFASMTTDATAKMQLLHDQAAMKATATKISVLTESMDMREQAIKNLEAQRAGVLAQLAKTTDPAQRHALEMKLAVITEHEKMELAAQTHAKQMRQKALAEYAKLEAQAKEHARQMKEGVLGHVADMAGGMVSTISSGVANALSSLGTMKDKAGAVLGDFATHALDALAGLPGKFFTFAVSLVQKILDGIKSMIGSVGKTLESGLNKSIHDIPVIGSMIPQFADGGTMTHTGMALVGEHGPELVRLPGGASVIPHGQTQGMIGAPAPLAAGNSPANGPMTVIFEMDGRQLARQVLPHMTNEIRLKTGLRL